MDAPDLISAMILTPHKNLQSEMLCRLAGSYQISGLSRSTCILFTSFWVPILEPQCRSLLI